VPPRDLVGYGARVADDVRRLLRGPPRDLVGYGARVADDVRRLL
jgi:hypothetical protein